MDLYIIDIKVFHNIPIASTMKHYHDCNDLDGAHFMGSLRFISKEMFFDGFFKFNAEFVNKIENFGNFVVSQSHVWI